MAEHHVRRLSTYSRQANEILHRVRHVAAMVLNDLGGHAKKRSRFRSKESGRLNLRFEFGRGGFRERCRVWVPLEKARGYLVDAFVGALRGKDRRNEELVGVR